MVLIIRFIKAKIESESIETALMAKPMSMSGILPENEMENVVIIKVLKGLGAPVLRAQKSLALGIRVPQTQGDGF